MGKWDDLFDGSDAHMLPSIMPQSNAMNDKTVDAKFEAWWDEEFGYGNYGNPPAPAIEAYRAGYALSAAEISQLRHDLLNEQAASRMAHEVVARNRALEAENAQLRHALANAQVAAGFAKEMVEKSKAVAAELISLAMLPDSYPSTALRDHIRRILRKLQP